jgi:hypothetical protein
MFDTWHFSSSPLPYLDFTPEIDTHDDLYVIWGQQTVLIASVESLQKNISLIEMLLKSARE